MLGLSITSGTPIPHRQLSIRWANRCDLARAAAGSDAVNRSTRAAGRSRVTSADFEEALLRTLHATVPHRTLENTTTAVFYLRITKATGNPKVTLRREGLDDCIDIRIAPSRAGHTDETVVHSNLT